MVTFALDFILCDFFYIYNLFSCSSSWSADILNSCANLDKERYSLPSPLNFVDGCLRTYNNKISNIYCIIFNLIFLAMKGKL